MIRAGLIALACTLAACLPSTEQVQLHVADGIAKAANDVAPGLVAMYTADLRDCLEHADTRPVYDACAKRVEAEWADFAFAWDHMRDVQLEYVDAVEKGKTSAGYYLDWLETAYCEVKAHAPAKLVARLPDIEGVHCKMEKR